MKAIAAAILILLFAITAAGCGGKHEHPKEQAAGITYYCPMHPQVKADKPGVCPICHMDLVPEGSGKKDAMPDGITLTAGEVAALHLTLVTPERLSIPRRITAFSTVTFDESRREVVSARFAGRVEKLYVSAEGSTVAAGTTLLTFYSPAVVQAQQDLLLAQEGGNAQLAAAAENRLMLYGLTRAQVTEIAAAKKVQQVLPLLSPAGGIVLSKKIKQGAYFNEGAELFELADVSAMWNTAEVFEGDATGIVPGSICTIRSAGREFTGKVTALLPQVNPQSRAVSIRSSVINKGGILKANMAGETVFNGGTVTGYFLPEEAVLFTGSRSVVWVTTDGASFIPTEVITGAKMQGKYQITAGINGGEQIAASAGYLLDSEGKLRGIRPVPTTATAPQPTPTQPTGSINGAGPGYDTPIYVTGSEKPFNSVCPILGEPLEGNPVKMKYKGKIIGFCCKGCDKKFIKQPDLYLANLSADGKKFLGDAREE